MAEETGLHIDDLQFRLLVAESGPTVTTNWLLFVFVSDVFDGKLRASGEGPVKWFSQTELPRIGMSPIDLTLQEYSLSDDPPHWARVDFDAQERVRRLVVEPLSAV